MQKTSLKTSLIAAISLLISVTLFSQFTFAQTSEFDKKPNFIEKYLYWLVPPKQETGPSPSDTLQAPFAASHNDIKRNELTSIYDEARIIAAGGDPNDLNTPHRSHEQIEEWVSAAVSRSLNFEMSDMKKFKGMVAPFYSDTGLASFKRFLIGINAISIMQANNKKVGSYVEQTPMLKKEGSDKGLYTWVYDVPVMMSYLDNSKPPRDGVAPINQNYLLRLKVQRTDNVKKHPEGLQISALSAKRINK